MEGTVVWVEASGEIWISGDGVTLPIQTRQAARPREGERIEVVGFLGMNAGQRILREAVWRSVGLGEVLTPTQVVHHSGEPRHGTFATIHGRVQAVSGREGRVRMVLSTEDDPAFVVEIGDSDPDQMRTHAPLGATVDVSGLVLRMANPAPGETALRLMVYEIGDVRTVQFPPWWTRERLMIFGFLALLLVLAALLWVTLLRRVVQKQTAQINAQNSRARELQEELEKTQRLESMGSMAEGITQDFEQLLQRIHFQLGEVLEGERFSWEARNRLDQAQAAVLRAQDLTRRLASFSLTGRSVLRSVEWVKVVRRELDSFELGPTIKLTAKLPDGDTLVRLDGAQFQQVIRGLLRNAVQAMPNGGTLKIEIRDEQIKTGDMNRLLPTGRYLRTEISDTGNGIPAADLNRVFDPYFTRKKGAKGLGLAVAYAVVRQHKGRIEVDSTEGKGTTVTLWLPRANP
jgi:signal transduction histidine kinase